MKPAQFRNLPPLCVLKFGGSVLMTETDYRGAAIEVYRRIRAREKVIVIVSALAGETDSLLTLAGPDACPAISARLLRLGEYRSAALMGLMLSRVGVRVRVLDPHEIGLEAAGEPLDAQLCALDESRLAEGLRNNDVLVIPGFTAGHACSGAATLGRGGADLTAVFFASRTGAGRVRLIKDVDGVYTCDPALEPDARRYEALDYDRALEASRGLIQPKAIEAARASGVTVEIAARGAARATLVHNGPCVIGAARQTRRMRVALLGCGSVGSGVLDHLRDYPDLFALNPVLVRNPSKHAGDRRAVFTDRLDIALGDEPDLLIELIGGVDEPARLMKKALLSGVDVVTANKAAVAAHYDGLHGAALSGGAQLCYAASVGGGAPVLETVAGLKSAGIRAIEGVMNGTGNFILDQLASGAAFDQAVSEAQRLGFAEADPRADVDGHDAADKLSVLIREAFGVSLPPGAIPKTPLSSVTPQIAVEAGMRGEVFKQIGRCELSPDGGVSARVNVEPVSANHPLAGARNEENRFLIRTDDGKIHVVCGKGAGRWPTAAAVFADIMDIQRMRACDGKGGANASPDRICEVAE